MKKIIFICFVWSLIYSPLLFASESTIHCLVQVGPNEKLTKNLFLQDVKEITLQKTIVPPSIGEAKLVNGDERFSYIVRFRDRNFIGMELKDVKSGQTSGAGPTISKNGSIISLNVSPVSIDIERKVANESKKIEYGRLVCLGESLYKQLEGELRGMK